MSDVILQVEKLSKRYRLGVVGRTALHEDLARWMARLRGRPDPTLRVDQLMRVENRKRQAAIKAGAPSPFSFPPSSDPSDHVWALRDVSFELERGEVMGVIGRNGSGKSTLLKILSRVTGPTSGVVRYNGRIASLLEVGTGFHPELTGRENVYLNGAILGMSRAEITAKFDEIVDFSGCSRFIDTPVKRYSSGMYVRLAFAVAAHLEPEILIVDEVLAVGDFEFQRKCLGKMKDVAAHGRTVLFVSHNLGSIQNLCHSAIWLDTGRVALAKDGAARVVAAYESSGCSESGSVDLQSGDHQVVSPFQIIRIEILGRSGQGTPIVQFGEPIRIRLVCRCDQMMDGVRAGIALRGHGVQLATMFSPDERFEAKPENQFLDCVIPGGVLLPGLFDLEIGASRYPGNIGLDYVRSALALSVSDVGVDSGWVYDRWEGGVVRIPYSWSRPGLPDVETRP